MSKGKKLKRVEENLYGAGKKKTDKYIVGQFISNPRGFGFVEVEGLEEDIFIPEEYVHGAFHTDTVEVELLSEQTGKRQEGRIRNILVRGMEELVGTYQAEKNFGFVVPDNSKVLSDIFIPIEHSGKAVTGDKVVVKLTDYGNQALRKKPEGKVTQVIGNINDPGVDILSIVKGFDIPYEFPEKVINQANRCPDQISEADMYGREDLRDVQMVTIDGEDAKDLDDAVSLYIDENGLYHLGVHIADVTNYVQESSALDREALKRGTSVYLVDRVIPMLPHRLSNGICSLNHGEDRLALSCLMTIDKNGGIIDHQIVESVINVNERMSYTSVAKILEEKDEAEIEKYKELVPMFQEMAELSAILRKKREDKGSIDFDFPETKIILDSEGNPIDIVPHERNVATKLIEDFMLAANETVAEHFFFLQSPFVYRIHEQPDPEKISTLSAFISNFGLHIRTRKDTGVRPKELQKLLKGIEGTKEEAVISRMALRSMMQAKYSTECLGHFGLAFDYYCHFTSPIRRYPDLQIHRIIKDHLRGRMTEAKASHYEEILDEVCKHSSETERRAEEAERETDKLKKAQYMENHIGERFEGIVSGVTAWGLFVELENSCEGIVRAASMNDDFYVYDDNSMKLVGESTHKEYSLGQKVMVKVVGADRIAKTIDFRLVSDNDDDDEFDENVYDSYIDIPKAKKISDERSRKIKKLGAIARGEETEYTSEKKEKKASGRSSKKESKKADKNSGRLVEYNGEMIDLSEYEPDSVTGGFRKKRSKSDKLSTSKRGKRSGSSDSEKKSTRKVYKVHKYKKSATSKAARSAQGKGRKRK
ncbi:ribonuclease R [Butyrivibrio hungatei DSM 14810]|uniref:Ribonuclease R n=1 Tax=Butyrivibrio hungatei DSM 14810 TaxID=1121132 RepID=A0A1M7SC64_9FIRM|nr:ribonuclease R [Butyrivibrio hungatei]SHN56080.1 ribonuclease R [Butyrivibrio hungatei DSM 14810]